MEGKSDATSLELRTAALDAYMLADYSLAAKLLRRVVERGFEVVSNRLHLARIGLVTDDIVAAREQVAAAWEQRAEAHAPYVLPRILWLQLALLYARPGEGPGADTASIILGRLKTAITRDGAHSEWAMDPVLAHLQPRLPADHHALLAALVTALSDATNVPALEQFPAWRDAEAQPIG